MDYKSIRFIKQKLDDRFSDPTYLGAYGRFVKMNSGMSIEEALLLGEPTSTSIEKLAGGITRIEATMAGASIFEGEPKVDYTKVTTIAKTDSGVMITDVLKYGDDELYTKVTTISEDEESGKKIIREEIE